MKAGDVCLISGGSYHETIRPGSSGSSENPLLFRPATEKDVVIVSGADQVPDTAWEKIDGSIWQTDAVMQFDHENQVFSEDTMLVEARWPNTGSDMLSPALSMMDSGTTPEKILDADIPDLDYTGAHVWLHTPKYWSNWTTKITGHGQGFIDIENIAPYKGSTSWHIAKEGAEFFIFGCMDLLDASNEYFYDSTEKKLYLYSKKPPENIFIKKRMIALDLKGLSHIIFRDIHIVGATIDTDSQTSQCVFDRMNIRYPYHSSQANRYYGTQIDKGVLLNGKNCSLTNSEISNSSGCGVVLAGESNSVINCFIHDTDYIGTYASCVQLYGKGNILSHCTLTRSGRTVLDYRGMYQALVQYNDMSHSGLLTSDLGLTYGNVIEGGNSEVRYNWLHDNDDDHVDMGLYYDHGTQNIISHHNVVWGVGYSAFHINFYGYYHLVYNNTFSAEKNGFRSAWGNKYPPDLYGCRFFNNIFSTTCYTSADNYSWGYNYAEYKDLIDNKYISGNSPLIDKALPVAGINDEYCGGAPDPGAYESGGFNWKPGHDFDNLPVVNTTRSKPVFRNRIVNAAFEHEDHIYPWYASHGKLAVYEGRKVQTTEDIDPLRMGSYSMELQSGQTEIVQDIGELCPDTWYEFAGWLRVDKGEIARLGVRNYGGPEILGITISGNSPRWNRCLVTFKTGPDSRSAQIFIRRESSGDGKVFIDDFGLIQK